MSFRPITLSEKCPTLTYRFAVQQKPNSHFIEILLISFHGRYRDGSSGKPDAGLIRGILATGVSVFRPLSVIIDLRDMEYKWGNDLDLSFREVDHTDVAVVVGDKCRKGMSTLRFGVNAKEDIVDNGFFFDNRNAAIEKLKQFR